MNVYGYNTRYGLLDIRDLRTEDGELLERIAIWSPDDRHVAQAALWPVFHRSLEIGEVVDVLGFRVRVVDYSPWTDYYVVNRLTFRGWIGSLRYRLERWAGRTKARIILTAVIWDLAVRSPEAYETVPEWSQLHLVRRWKEWCDGRRHP